VNVEVQSVSWAAAGAQIVCDVSLDCASGRVAGLLGPNGSGKSSLLRCIYRVLRPDAGSITVDGQEVWRMSARDSARRIAVVLQERAGTFEFSVREIVLMGRSPHKRPLEWESAEDMRIVDRALAQVGLSALADRSFPTLSGGEQQRALVARALVQHTQVLVLDEPTTHLDVRYQLQMLDLVCDLKLTTIAALHDLNLAAAYCDHLYVLRDGALVASGTPGEVLTSNLIRDVYGVDADVTRHPLTGRPSVTYLPARASSRTLGGREDA